MEQIPYIWKVLIAGSRQGILEIYLYKVEMMQETKKTVKDKVLRARVSTEE